jgi:pyrroline-5-carboxylate reductase
VSLPDGPVLLVGAGRMGQALIQGWRRSGALDPSRLIIVSPNEKPEVTAAVQAGARFNPPDAVLAEAKTVVFCVKPFKRIEAAEALIAKLAPDAVIVSVIVGVQAEAISALFGGRRVARVLPTTGVARAAGVTAVFGTDSEALARTHALFDPISATVDLPEEEMMDAAGAVSASGVAYVYAFAQALDDAARVAGLPPEIARTLARATVTSAAGMMEETGAEPEALIEQVASPAGTTRAALAVLRGEQGIEPLLRDTVAAAIRRSKELATS